MLCASKLTAKNQMCLQLTAQSISDLSRPRKLRHTSTPHVKNNGHLSHDHYQRLKHVTQSSFEDAARSSASYRKLRSGVPFLQKHVKKYFPLAPSTTLFKLSVSHYILILSFLVFVFSMHSHFYSLCSLMYPPPFQNHPIAGTHLIFLRIKVYHSITIGRIELA